MHTLHKCKQTRVLKTKRGQATEIATTGGDANLPGMRHGGQKAAVNLPVGQRGEAVEHPELAGGKPLCEDPKVGEMSEIRVAVRQGTSLIH